MGLLLLAAALPGFAALVDDRTFNGVGIWLKPLKFAVALAIYALTLALYARALPAGMTGRAWYRIYRAAVLAAIGAELAWIAGAAAAGTASHFNTQGAWAAIYPVMGLLATLLTSISAVYAVAIARNPRAGLPPALRDGLVLGLALVLPLTLVTAGTLSGNGGHLVGVPPDMVSDAGAFPFFGWSREVGDLRVAHFLGTDAMHFVPAFALVSTLVLGGTRRGPVCAFALAFTGLATFAFLQALDGRPFLPMIGGPPPAPRALTRPPGPPAGRTFSPGTQRPSGTAPGARP